MSARPPIDRTVRAGTEFLLVDADGRVVQASTGAAALLGRGAAALIGLGVEALFPDAALLARLREHVDPSRPAAAPAAVKDSRVNCGALGVAHFDIEFCNLPSTATALLVMRSTDPAAEAARATDWQAMMQRLQAVVDLLPIAMWIAEDDLIIFGNRAAARLVGSGRPGEIVGRSVKSLLRADAHGELERQLSTALQSPGIVSNLSATLVRQDAPARQVEIALTALPDHGHTTVQMVMHDVTRRQSEMRELERSRMALRRLSANMVEGREAERQRIARELHDELGQSLLALKLDLADCARTDRPSATRNCLHGALERLDGIMNSVRRIAADLRPLMLDELGPGPAIEWLVTDFSRRTGLRCKLHLDEIGPLDDKTAITLYRMVQESLTNVRRHAQATEVVVELSRQGDQIQLRVSDNGVGLPADSALRDSQFGLLGMRERADMLGGDLILDSTQGAGTSVRMRIPLHPPPQP